MHLPVTQNHHPRQIKSYNRNERAITYWYSLNNKKKKHAQNTIEMQSDAKIKYMRSNYLIGSDFSTARKQTSLRIGIVQTAMRLTTIVDINTYCANNNV